jgi:hypothetical protein
MTSWTAAVVRQRLPAKAVALRDVTVLSAWLGDNRTGAIAPYASFSAGKAAASWLPDEPSARAWRDPAPDGRLVAVCQEISQFDGPAFGVRLESPDGSLVRRLYEIGDGDPCSELAWSPDGRTLAVLSAHVARLRVVDVDWALPHLETPTAHWSWRLVDLSTQEDLRMGQDLRFVDPREVELTVCSYNLPKPSVHTSAGVRPLRCGNGLQCRCQSRLDVWRCVRRQSL